MNIQGWILPVLSTVIVSLISLTGIVFLKMPEKKLERIIFIWVSLAVGVILGNTFLDLVPESYEYFNHSEIPSLLICGGIVLFFIAEKVLHWHHHHVGETVKPVGKISLLADGIHNFTDGVLIAAAWMSDWQLGVSTTVAVCVHEVPQEIADYGILLHAGYTKRKALMWNFISALTAILGTVFMLLAGSWISQLSQYILPLAAGGFIYLAGSDLIPELNKQHGSKNATAMQVSMVILGIAIIYLLSLGMEGHTH